MLSSMLLVMLAAATNDPAWIGSVTLAHDGATLTRKADRYAVRHGAGLLAGDVLRTSEHGAAIYLFGDLLGYMAPETTLELHDARGKIEIFVREGEARLTSSGQKPFVAATPLGTAELQRGVVRIHHDRYSSAIESVSGQVRFVMQNGQVLALQKGEQRRLAVVDGSFQPVAASRTRWTIDPDQYQSASLQESIAVHNRPHGNCCPPQPKTSTEEEKPSETETAQNEQQPQQQQNQNQNQNQQSNSSSRVAAGAGSALALGGFSGAGFGGTASAGSFTDANQQTLQGQRQAFLPPNGALGEPFPGNIHIVTGETRYGFSGVHLTPSEQAAIFPGGNNAYWSIGVGTPPTAQVTTGALTASAPVPKTVAIPRTNNYLIRLDQYGTPDPALDPAGAEANNVGTFGYLGETPTAPEILGATPVLDERSKINQKATFAMGEFRLSPNGDTVDLAIRSSDQDRIIIKDPGGNDANDIVRTNPDVTFRDVVDPRFLPAAPTVKVPERNTGFRSTETTFSNLNFLRRAATTTLMADQLYDYARRTGQTRFVIRENDGRQRIIDITGYQR